MKFLPLSLLAIFLFSACGDDCKATMCQAQTALGQQEQQLPCEECDSGPYEPVEPVTCAINGYVISSPQDAFAMWNEPCSITSSSFFGMVFNTYHYCAFKGFNANGIQTIYKDTCWSGCSEQRITFMQNTTMSCGFYGNY
jgi:hypothetical protein